VIAPSRFWAIASSSSVPTGYPTRICARNTLALFRAINGPSMAEPQATRLHLRAHAAIRGMAAADASLWAKRDRPKLKRHREQDAWWPWHVILTLHRGSSFVVECHDEIQGMLALRARPKSFRGRRGVYVGHLAIAAHNRSSIGRQRFRDVGALLLAKAVRFSESLDLGGCLLLHSLPNARPFYVTGRSRRCGSARPNRSSSLNE
jgi:hypothetical protein